MKNKVAITRTIKMLCSKYLSVISYFFPKKNNLWIFGAWQGQQYSDNSKYMFEYVVRNHPEIHAVWITRREDIVERLTKKGMKCVKRFSVKGIFYALTAQIAFETEGNQDISPFLNSHCTKIIQQWHGFPLKAMQWKKKDGSVKMRTPKEYDAYYWISCSQEYTKLMNECLGVNTDRFELTGYPRNDAFINCTANQDVSKFINRRPSCKHLIYMPTHRNFGKEGNEFINIEAFVKLDKMLKGSNLVMVYKPHFHEMKHFEGIDNALENIHFAKESYWNDVYSYLHMFDVLISDYSSVITDFVCSGKPVVLFPYDIENYKSKDAGLTKCFYDSPLGPFCFTWDEVIKQCSKLCIDDTWSAKRNENFSIYQAFNDGKNCERVYAYAKMVAEG